jgi:hypothetical protein
MSIIYPQIDVKIWYNQIAASKFNIKGVKDDAIKYLPAFFYYVF